MSNVEKGFHFGDFKKHTNLPAAVITKYVEEGHIPAKSVYYPRDVEKFLALYNKDQKKQKPIESLEIYTQDQFKDAAGISKDSFNTHITRKNLKRKEFYTQKELDKFLKDHPPRKRVKTGAGPSSPEDKYTLAQLGKKIGIVNPYDLRNRGRIPNKPLYSDQDVTNFLAIKNQSSKSSAPTEGDIYSAAQFAKKTGMTDSNVYLLKSKGKLPKKTMFSDEDVANYLATKAQNGGRRTYTKREPVENAVKFSVSENPFEFIEDVMVAEKNPFFGKLIDMMIKLPVYSGDSHQGIRLPANIYSSGQKAQSAVNGAKGHIRKNYKAMTDSQFRVMARKDAAGKYTHSVLFRTH